MKTKQKFKTFLKLLNRDDICRTPPIKNLIICFDLLHTIAIGAIRLSSESNIMGYCWRTCFGLSSLHVNYNGDDVPKSSPDKKAVKPNGILGLEEIEPVAT